MNWAPRPDSTDERIIQHVYHENGYEMPDDMTDQFVIDIGANIGTFSALCAERGASVLAFEPEPSNFKALQRSVEGLLVAIMPYALGPEHAALSATPHGFEPIARTTTLYYHESNTGAHSTIEQVGDRKIKVPCTSLESILYLPAPAPPPKYWRSWDVCDVLKLDCEGAEVYAWDTIIHHHERFRRIVCELHMEREEQLAIVERLDPFYTARNIFQADWSFDHRPIKVGQLA